MAEFTTKIDNVDVTVKLIDNGFSVSHAEMGVKRIAVKLYEQLYSMGDVIQIYKGDDLIFQGEVEKESVRPGSFTCFAGDKLLILSNEVARHESHREYANTEVSVIVKDLLDYYYSGEFDQTNIDVTSTTVGYIDLKDKPINECLTILANRAGFVFYLMPPNLFYFKAKDSVSSGYSAVYGTNIENLNITRDNFVKTKVIVRMALGEVTRGTGSRIAIVADDTITEEADAQQLGDAILEEMQDIRIRGDIVLTECRHDLIPGTTIVLHAPQFGFANETIRIKQVTYTPFKTKLQVGLLTAMKEDQLIDFEERIKRIENRGIDWNVSCNVSMQTAPGCLGACEIDCQSTCQVTCQSGDCQAGICQTDCQTTQQILCVTDEQVCGTLGTCQVSCEDGHKCDTTCQSECQNPCQTQCQIECQQSCQGGCETGCQSQCELGCMSGCETTCETGCETGCQSTCQTTCQSTCEVTCQTGCEVTCQGGCETACKVYCQSEEMCCGTIGPD